MFTQADRVDIHEWDAEESANKRKESRDQMIPKVERSVRANGGNPGFVKGMLRAGANINTKKYRCAAAYIWYSIKQDQANPGETAYTDCSEWQYRCPTWNQYLKTTIGDSGEVERKKMMNLIGDALTTLHPTIVEACQLDLDRYENEQLTKIYPGIKKPKLRLESFQIGTCEVQLGDEDAYNDHMRNLHGVTTTISNKRHRSGLYPNLDATPKSNGVEKVLNELVPTLKTISSSTGNHIPMNRLQAKPGRKEVQMGIEDLKVNLIADGRLVPGELTAPLDSYGHITQRMKELVHENDHPAMIRTYAQLAGRRWERGHKLVVEHMEKAIRDIINKNSAEIAMKKFDDFRFSEKRGLSSQIVDVANTVEEFFQEEMQITAYEKDKDGEAMPLLINPTYSKVLKDAFCIYKIVTKAPEYDNSGYKGKLRELLQPAMDNISLFDIDHLCKVLKEWEECLGYV